MTQVEDLPLSESQLADRLLEHIERLEVLEEQLGIRLEGLSVRVSVESNQLTILGEIYSRDGATLTQDTVLKAVVYGPHGRVLAINSDSFYRESFNPSLRSKYG